AVGPVPGGVIGCIAAEARVAHGWAIAGKAVNAAAVDGRAVVTKLAVGDGRGAGEGDAQHARTVGAVVAFENRLVNAHQRAALDLHPAAAGGEVGEGRVVDELARIEVNLAVV